MNQVNVEFENNKPKFSYNNIKDAFDYAYSGVNLHPDEIGIEVYLKLFEEKIFEYLSNVEVKNTITL